MIKKNNRAVKPVKLYYSINNEKDVEKNNWVL